MLFHLSIPCCVPAVLSRLASSPDDGPQQAVKLFNSITRRVRRFPDMALVADSSPDTAAFNNVLNACANLGDRNMFLQLFDEMPEFERRLFGRAGVGIDNVDMSVATEYGCLVVNAPTANTVAAAEHGIALY